jgi:hypothetical protein
VGLEVKLPRYWYFIILGILLLIYWFGRWQSAQGRESGTIIANARQALASGKAYRARQVALQQIAISNMNLAREAQRGYQVRGALIVKLDTALSRATTMAESLSTVQQQNVQLRGQVSDLLVANLRLERARLADSTRADHAEIRVAELERHLAATLTVADCHIAGVAFLPRCPSRTVSAVLGIGLGVTGMLLIR